MIEAEGFDPEENDKRIKADQEREEELGLDFAPAKPAAPFGGEDDAEDDEQKKQDAEENEDEDAA